MTYQASFLYAPGEPHSVAAENSGDARSVWSAIHVFQAEHPDAWIRMARECFDLKGPKDAALLQAEGVMFKIEETAACDVTGDVTRVFIDGGKKFWVEVRR